MYNDIEQAKVNTGPKPKKSCCLPLSRLRTIHLCYVYGLCLPLWTYLLTDKWVTVQKHLRTSLGTPLCILFRFFLTYCHFLTLLGVCTVHGTLLTEGSASISALDLCMVQETSMADGSASKVLQTCVQYMEMPLVDGRRTICVAQPYRRS
jgi:hypothetical protein